MKLSYLLDVQVAGNTTREYIQTVKYHSKAWTVILICLFVFACIVPFLDGKR